LKGKEKSDIARPLNDNDIVVVESDFFRVLSKIVLTFFELSSIIVIMKERLKNDSGKDNSQRF
jgi:hypothetical protein